MAPTPAQQAARDPGRAARTPRNFARAGRLDPDAEQAGPAGHHALQFRLGIEVQPDRNAEPVTQRRGQQALARGGTDQGERRQIDPHRTGRGPFSDDQVERAVFHRRIEHFLNLRVEAMDLVNEQDIALFQVGQQRGQVTRLGDDRTRRGAKADTECQRSG